MNRQDGFLYAKVLCYSFIALMVFAAVNLLNPARAGAQDNRSFYFPKVIV